MTTARGLRLTSLLLLAAGVGLIGWSAYIPAKAALAQVQLERAWQQTVAGHSTVKPWPWADTWPVAKLTVPRLEKSAVVLEGASGEAMAFGPGHMTQTAAIGAPGTAIIAAHRDTHFRFVKDLTVGDVIALETPDGTMRDFIVTATQIVHAAASGIDPRQAGASGASIALVTCYPFDGITRGPLRYVVFADLLQSAGTETAPHFAGTS